MIAYYRDAFNEIFFKNKLVSITIFLFLFMWKILTFSILNMGLVFKSLPHINACS